MVVKFHANDYLIEGRSKSSLGMLCSKPQSSPYLVKAHFDDSTTHITFTLKSPEECDTIQLCHNTEEAPHTSFEEEMDFDPKVNSNKIVLLLMSP